MAKLVGRSLRRCWPPTVDGWSESDPRRFLSACKWKKSTTSFFSFTDILLELHFLPVLFLNGAIYLASFLFDYNQRNDARFVANQRSCHIVSIHIITLAALEANCSLGGDSWHSLADVDLILSHGSGEFSKKRGGEGRLPRLPHAGMEEVECGHQRKQLLTSGTEFGSFSYISSMDSAYSADDPADPQ